MSLFWSLAFIAMLAWRMQKCIIPKVAYKEKTRVKTKKKPKIKIKIIQELSGYGGLCPFKKNYFVKV